MGYGALKKNLMISIFLMIIWLVNISFLQLLPKWGMSKHWLLSVVILTSFLGGYAISMFSLLALDLLHLS